MNVYRLFGCHGELLYIGCANNVASRVRVHRATKRGAQIAKHTVTEFGSRRDALLAEASAIKEEQPKWNIKHKFKTKPEAKREELIALGMGEESLMAFRAWGRMGGKARAKKYTSKQISEMAKKAREKRGKR